MHKLTPEEFDRFVGYAIQSLDLETRLKNVDPFQSVHFVASSHFSTLTNLGDGKHIIEPNYGVYAVNMTQFIESELTDYYTYGFVPMDKKSRDFLITTPRLTVLFGKKLPYFRRSFDLYLIKSCI